MPGLSATVSRRNDVENPQLIAVLNSGFSTDVSKFDQRGGTDVAKHSTLVETLSPTPKRRGSAFYASLQESFLARIKLHSGSI